MFGPICTYFRITATPTPTGTASVTPAICIGTPTDISNDIPKTSWTSFPKNPKRPASQARPDGTGWVVPKPKNPNDKDPYVKINLDSVPDHKTPVVIMDVTPTGNVKDVVVVIYKDGKPVKTISTTVTSGKPIPMSQPTPGDEVIVIPKSSSPEDDEDYRVKVNIKVCAKPGSFIFH